MERGSAPDQLHQGAASVDTEARSHKQAARPPSNYLPCGKSSIPSQRCLYPSIQPDLNPQTPLSTLCRKTGHLHR